MKLRDFFLKAIAAGIDNDPRGTEAVQIELHRKESDFLKLSEEKKELFDRELLSNPYPDSRILFGEDGEEILRILVGIDIGVGEVLLADRLREKGQAVNLLVAHHPEGRAYANLYSVMHMQSDILHRMGVPINLAEDLMEGRAKEVERKILPANHTRVVDAARLLGIPFVCLHTPADNMVTSYLNKIFKEQKPYVLQDVLDILLSIPEYRDATLNGAGPRILLGSESRKAGKIFVDMTGGTEGSKDVFESLTLSGVNTIVAIHVNEEHRKEAEKNHLNLIIAGHISSDNLGINLLLDRILHNTEIVSLECSGFVRRSRAQVN